MNFNSIGSSYLRATHVLFACPMATWRKASWLRRCKTTVGLCSLVSCMQAHLPSATLITLPIFKSYYLLAAFVLLPPLPLSSPHSLPLSPPITMKDSAITQWNYPHTKHFLLQEMLSTRRRILPGLRGLRERGSEEVMKARILS